MELGTTPGVLSERRAGARRWPAGGRGGRGLTCPGGIGAAALYSRGGPGAGLEGASERRSRLLPADERTDRWWVHCRVSRRPGREWGGAGPGVGLGLQGELGLRAADVEHRAGGGGGPDPPSSGVPRSRAPPAPTAAGPLPPRALLLPGRGRGGRLRVTTAHGPPRWLGQSEKLSRVPRLRAPRCPAPGGTPHHHHHLRPGPTPSRSPQLPARGEGRPTWAQVGDVGGRAAAPSPSRSGQGRPSPQLTRPPGGGGGRSLSRRAAWAAGPDRTAGQDGAWVGPASPPPPAAACVVG